MPRFGGLFIYQLTGGQKSMEGDRHEVTEHVTLVSKSGGGVMPPFHDSGVPWQNVEEVMPPLGQDRVGTRHKGAIHITSVSGIASVAEGGVAKSAAVKPRQVEET
jgi:hypothetical protein